MPRCDAYGCVKPATLAVAGQMIRLLPVTQLGEERAGRTGYVALCPLHATRCGIVQLAMELEPA